MRTFITTALVLLALAATERSQAQVMAQNRALIIVSELDSTGIPELAPLYATLENLTNGLPNLLIVDNSYREIHTLRNANATLAQFRTLSRQLAMRPEISAIDVFMVLHGRDNKLKFADGTVEMPDLVEFMNQATNGAQQVIVNRTKRKFRVMYNTSCFGASHRAAFRAVGFDVASGSIGVNANSELEYPSFLAMWNLNSTFGQALAPTNTAVALAAADGPLVATGLLLNNFLKNVNSRKLISGNANIRITTPAQ